MTEQRTKHGRHAGASLCAGRAGAQQRLRRMALVASGFAAAALALVLDNGPAFSQATEIAVSRAMWVVAPSPTLDITVELGQLCNGKASCQFVLSPATFGGKTPAGAGKHILLVQYRCGAAGKNGSGFDNETIVLTCP